MKAIKTNIPDVVILEPEIHGDDRGYFFESWTERDFARLVAPVHFVQENQSRSHRGVLRGLHFQRPPFAQAKLVRVVEGTVIDVAVDLRLGSPTYGRYTAVELSADNKRQLFIPRGMAHGFFVPGESTTFIYKCDNYYHPESEGGIAWNDTDLNIEWPLSGITPDLSAKDRLHGSWADFKSPFTYDNDLND